MFTVKEAVKKAELDASLAAEDAMRHGHKAESRVSNNKDSSEQAEGSTDHVTGDSKSTSHLRTYSSLGTLIRYFFLNLLSKMTSPKHEGLKWWSGRNEHESH